MIVNWLFSGLTTIIKFIFSFVYLPDFHLEDTFSTYLSWFNTLLDSVTSLIAFLIPRQVFFSSIAIFVFIVEFDHIMMFLRFILGFIPFIRTRY